MSFFGNKRRDFSIQPPRQQVDGTPFFVTDSSNIDFTLENLNLTADLTLTGVVAGTYGSSSLIPILEIDQWGRVTGVTTTTFSASGIALETNSNPNDSQTILNLLDGTDIEVVDLGGGDIQFNYVGTGGTYTADNGITETANNFQLGGTLLQNTTITNDSLYNLSITGSLSGNGLFKVNNSKVTFFEDVTTKAIIGQAQSGIAVFGDSVDNYGVYGSSKNSIGVRGISTNNYAISGTGNYITAGYFQVDNPSSGILDVIRIARKDSVSAQGVGISLETSVADGSLQVSNRIKSNFTDTNFSSRTSQLQITSLNNAIESTTLTLKGTGQLQLNKYTAAFSGTAVYGLGVDASGNVITTTASPTTGDSVSPFLLMGG
jgi:hypothetical protein